MIDIELPNDKPDFTVQVSLDGSPYTLRFVWNMRSGWYCQCTASDGVVLCAQRRIVADWDMLTGVVDERRPSGLLTILDLSGSHLRPGRTAFGVTHQLTYFTLEELSA